MHATRSEFTVLQTAGKQTVPLGASRLRGEPLSRRAVHRSASPVQHALERPEDTRYT